MTLPRSPESPRSATRSPAPSVPSPAALDDEHAPLYTVGQVASMLEVRQALLRRIDEYNVVSPRRSAGGQRRYSRHEIGQVQHVMSMMGEGMSLAAIRRIIEMEYQLARLTSERDELRARLAARGEPIGGADPAQRRAWPDRAAGEA
ncbi:MAG TPA: MerR family transcriptional regulator [Streptosporangiaceae bacterium]